MNLTGYRMILFGLVMGTAGLLGHHLAPDTLNAWLDVFFFALTIGIILLRAVTKTAVFQHELAAPGIPAEIRDALVSLSSQVRVDRPELISAVSQLNQSVATLAGHPLTDPATMALLTDALSKLAEPAVDPALQPGGGGIGGGPLVEQKAAAPGPQPGQDQEAAHA